MLRTVFLTALALILAAVLLVLVPVAVQGRSTLALHCVLNGAVYYAAWLVYRPHAEVSGLTQWAVQMGAYAFGAVDTFLAGRVLFDYQPQNAVLLALVLPAAVGWLILSIDDFRKKRAEETAVEDAAVLSEKVAEEPVPLASAARTAITAALFTGGYVIALVLLFALGTSWFHILWAAVNDGIVFDSHRILNLLLEAATEIGLYPLKMAGLVAAITLVMVFGGALFGRLFRKGKRKIHGDLSPEQQALVETRLRALWDYANRPDRENKTFAAAILPIMIIGTAVAAPFALLFCDHELASWFLQRRLPDAWYVLIPSSLGFLFAIVALPLTGWSLWHVIVSRWPGAAESVVTLQLRRGQKHIDSAVSSTRHALIKMVRKGGNEPFDPRQYLLDRRRRFGKGLLWTAAVAAVVGIWGIWASLNSYTLITPAGIEDSSAITGKREFYPYREVRQVKVSCTINGKGESNFGWRMLDISGRELARFRQVDVHENLPALLAVDTVLREQGTAFDARDPESGESLILDACLEDVGSGLDDQAGFIRLMHRD